jgi:hypothetical protein
LQALVARTWTKTSAGLVQACAAVSAVESGVRYLSHAIDDGEAGNGDLMLDPGERVVMQITVESRTDAVIEELEGILSTRAPGVTVHNQHATFPLFRRAARRPAMRRTFR